MGHDADGVITASSRSAEAGGLADRVSMRIERLSLISGARRARGLAVIIDVLRAFTTAAYAMANGAEGIIPIGCLEEAFELKRLHPGWVLMGERGGRRVEGFDYGNSPFKVRDVDLTGKTVIQSTGAGTQGVVNAKGAKKLILGSFVTAGAIVRHIQRARPRLVSLVAMGSRGVARSVDDELCASYIEDALMEKTPDFEEIRRLIRGSPSGAKFFDPAQPQYREEDFHMALELDRFDFILMAERDGGLNFVRKHL
ncbi:MAG: 2-phosphosulfolactate phosphatase [Candidatus Bathyarchaeota archaeon]|nr:2-phosphosulfolactate phosphatase [Candidatus Bathyarchaeota archaeon]